MQHLLCCTVPSTPAAAGGLISLDLLCDKIVFLTCYRARMGQFEWSFRHGGRQCVVWVIKLVWTALEGAMAAGIRQRWSLQLACPSALLLSSVELSCYLPEKMVFVVACAVSSRLTFPVITSYACMLDCSLPFPSPPRSFLFLACLMLPLLRSSLQDHHQMHVHRHHGFRFHPRAAQDISLCHPHHVC